MVNTRRPTTTGWQKPGMPKLSAGVNWQLMPDGNQANPFVRPGFSEALLFSSALGFLPRL
jgi:hypothetical protein